MTDQRRQAAQYLGRTDVTGVVTSEAVHGLRSEYRQVGEYFRRNVAGGKWLLDREPPDSQLSCSPPRQSPAAAVI